MEPEILAGRECGSCNVCCVSLTIDDPELQKPQGYRCRNAQRDNSCAIYPTRPNTCRQFNCGWRLLRFVREGLRPDKSGLLFRMHMEKSSTTAATTMGVIVTLLNNAALKAEGLAESVAAAVDANVPVFLSVPGPPGFTSGIARVNEALADAVAFKDKPAMLRILGQAYRKGRTGDHTPIRLTPRAPADLADPP